MSVPARLLAVTAGFLLPALALGGWLLVRGAPRPPPGLGSFPRVVGDWTVTERRSLSPEERAMLEPAAYLAWLFAAPERLPITLYVALYLGQSGDGKGAHDPALCYPASGWEVLDTRSVEVRVATGGTLEGKLLTAHKGNEERKALYWFQPAGRWPDAQSWEQVERIGDALAGRPQFAFVRLSAPVVPGRDAEKDLLDFAAEIGWPVRAALAPEPERDG